MKMANKKSGAVRIFLKKFSILNHPVIQILLRITIGFLLIYFSLYKITDPSEWAEVIYQFRLVPDGIVNILAVFLSWAELFAGIGIILGLFTRASALLASGLVLTFLAALQINIWREVYIYCGCFRHKAYMTDVTYQNRNITFYILILTLLILFNNKPRIALDSIISRRRGKRSS
jgi:putative oxidoreductase